MSLRHPPTSEIPADRLPPRSGLLAPYRGQSRRPPPQEIFEDEPPPVSDGQPGSPVGDPMPVSTGKR